MAQFMFATEIESSYPTVQWHGRTIRQDEFAKTRHYDCWREDFQDPAGTRHRRTCDWARRILRPTLGAWQVQTGRSRTRPSTRCAIDRSR